MTFAEVRPGFAQFATMLLGQLCYQGLLVCIGPRTTGMGDIQKLHAAVQAVRPEVGLVLARHSCSSIAGRGELT